MQCATNVSKHSFKYDAILFVQLACQRLKAYYKHELISFQASFFRTTMLMVSIVVVTIAMAENSFFFSFHFVSIDAWQSKVSNELCCYIAYAYIFKRLSFVRKVFPQITVFFHLV